MRSRTIRSLRACALLACACALVVGCTPRQSQDQYEERLDRALSVREEVSNRLSARDYEDPASYETASGEVLAALDDLDADPPPRNLEDAHERMVHGLEALAVLLDRLGRCESLGKTASAQDRRACRQSIGQDVYDTIRNDFTEANTIYRQEGLSLPGLGGDGQAGGGEDTLGGDPEGGDEL